MQWPRCRRPFVFRLKANQPHKSIVEVSKVELREILRVLLRGCKIILSAVLICLVAGAAVLAAETPEYRATTRLYVKVAMPQDATEEALAQATRLAQINTITYKELVRTNLVLGPVVDDLDLDISSAQLSSHVTSLAALDTAIIDIIVAWDQPDEAARIANSIATQAITFLSEETSESSPSVELIQAEPAIAPTSKAAPNPAVILGVTGLGGLLLGCAIVLTLHAVRRRIHSPEDLDGEKFGPVLGTLGTDFATPSPRAPNQIDRVAGTLREAERFRTQRNFVVVSCSPTANTTRVAEQLGERLRSEGVDVVSSQVDLAGREPIENARSFDSALVVVTAGHDSRADVAAAVGQLDLLGIPVAGFILIGAAKRHGGSRARQAIASAG